MVSRRRYVAAAVWAGRRAAGASGTTRMRAPQAITHFELRVRSIRRPKETARSEPAGPIHASPAGIHTRPPTRHGDRLRSPRSVAMKASAPALAQERCASAVLRGGPCIRACAGQRGGVLTLNLHCIAPNATKAHFLKEAREIFRFALCDRRWFRVAALENNMHLMDTSGFE